MRVSSFWVVSFDLIPSKEGLWLCWIEKESRRVKSLQISFLLSKSSKNVHLVASHAGWVSVSFLRGNQTGRQVILMCLHTGAYLALSLEVRACVLIWFDSFSGFVFNVRLSSRKHNPLGVFKLFLGLRLQTSVAERLISFMACLGRLFAKLAQIWTRIELVGPRKALNRFSCSCILGLAEKF